MNNDIYFEVIGAGKIEISISSNYCCGGQRGFSFGVEWGRHDYAGGVLSRQEAIKLAEHILKYADVKNLRRRKLKSIENSLI